MTAVVLLAARLLLGTVFIAAGLGKLADLPGSQRAMRGFGVTSPLAALLGVLLPVAEIGVGALLWPRGTAWWAAVTSLGLLVAFMAGISLNLARGRQPDCHCFGTFYSEPVGPRALIRNGVLALVALILVIQGPSDPGMSAVAWIGTLDDAERILALLAAATLIGFAGVLWLMMQLLRQQGRLLLRIEALEAERTSMETAAAVAPWDSPAVGAVAPEFALSGLDGAIVTLADLRASGRRSLLLLMDPACGPCSALLPDVGRWQSDLDTRVNVIVISRGTPEENRPKAVKYRLAHVLLQDDREVSERYGVSGTPSAVLVQPDGRIGAPVAQGAEEIRALVSRLRDLQSTDIPVLQTHERAIDGHAHTPCPHCDRTHSTAPPADSPSGLAIGTPAPAIHLPDTSGAMVELPGDHGAPQLILFFNPNCGFCQQLLPELQAWEAAPPPGSPQLVVVSAGSIGQNLALGLRSRLLLDDGFVAGAAYGAAGTPSAVLIDALGMVASPVVVGGPAVLAQARGTSKDGAHTQ